MIYKSFLDCIGNTPLVALPLSSNTQLCAKLEYLNPGGSIKDRSALYMIEHAEKTGKLKKGSTIIDASSGNHGIATAMIGAAKGYKVIITVSERISQEKQETMRAYGAQVVVCAPTLSLEDPNSFLVYAEKLHHEIPDSFFLNQHYSLFNRESHYQGLGPEIWRQTKGAITHFFAGAGTTGTISGVGQFLKEQNPNIKIIAVESAHSVHATQGHPKPVQLEGIGISYTNPSFNTAVVDEIVPVAEENAIATIRSLAHTSGLLLGPSSGAVAAVALQYAPHMKKTDLGVLIFGDSGRAYLTKQFFINAEDNSYQHKTSSSFDLFSPLPSVEM